MRRPFRVRLFGALLAPAVLALPACGSEGATDVAAATGGAAPEVTVTHAQGSTTLPAKPEKVVVFDLGVLTTLDELGVKVAGVPAVEGLPDKLSQYAGDGYPKVGSLFEPDYEKVNALDPDLIVVAGRSSAAYAELAKIAPTVDLTVDNAAFLDSFRERTTALGTIFGKEAEVKQRLDAIDAAAAEVKAKAGDRTGLVVLTTGGKISAHGPGGRFGMVHDALGVKPAAEGLKTETHGEAISAEFIGETDPDLLYVVDRDAAIGESGAAAKQVLDNALVNGTKAAKNGKIVYLDPFAWYLAPTALSSVDAMVKAVGDSLS
ncbi:siderophore ABC transporter substrate-binding protein [Nonomuraea sp. MCN248]|uniref:Siderophore ABC transporter substrate-binding protein n=1 Tax=Nonomuraea corallina TaxID=2989783 RepID=A0ABT4S9C6_9ACTN|nr:siderophore ABC transporter substrate-binding protein [Nonomuraea corallina]MDA0633760.1 siderophore ABC transporter substrate-binding protein [Nonomuraea corallina]